VPLLDPATNSTSCFSSRIRLTVATVTTVNVFTGLFGHIPSGRLAYKIVYENPFGNYIFLLTVTVHILNWTLKQIGIILEVAKTLIALVTEQATYSASGVVMINCESLTIAFGSPSNAHSHFGGISGFATDSTASGLCSKQDSVFLSTLWVCHSAVGIDTLVLDGVAAPGAQRWAADAL
jgi:hypothetical protein